MSFSFDPSLASKRDEVRFLIQDTTDSGHLFEDETIDALLLSNGDNVLETLAVLAQTLWTQYLQKADVAEVDDVRIEYRNKANQMKDFYDDVKKRSKMAKLNGKTPIYFGGINRAKFDQVREDSSVVKPEFTKGNIFFNEDFPELTPVDEPLYERDWY